VRYLYPNGPPWANAVPTAGGETLILHGDPGSGLEEAAAWIADASVPPLGPVISFDPSLIGDYTSLVRRLVVDVTAAAFGDDAATHLAALEHGDPVVLPEFGRANGDFLSLTAMRVNRDASVASGSLGRVLRAAPGALVIVHHAHLLTDRWSRDALWELRGVIQDDRRHALVLTCPKEARESLDGPEAPFLGAGAIAEVGAERTDRLWRRVAKEHDIHISPDDLELVLARTWGLAVPTLAILLDTPSLGVRAALDQHVRSATPRIPLVLQMARIINRYGPELLLRLSRGLPPYAIPSATSRDVNRALRNLAFHGLVVRVGTRGWRVADPLLSDGLLSRPLAAW
jgi:hypothetical protein